MDALPTDPDTALPSDVTALQALVRELLGEVARLRAENAELKIKLDAATKHRFGRRSERKKPAPADPKPARRRDEHGRSVLPEGLERRDVSHDLSDEQKLCPGCGRARECIGEQATEQLDLDPPRFFVLRTRKRSYACRHCAPNESRVVTAGPAQVGPIPKGLCGPGLLAHVITAKFADHAPVHRLAGQLARSGVKVARSTLGDWLKQAAGLLDPLVECTGPANHIALSSGVERVPARESHRIRGRWVFGRSRTICYPRAAVDRIGASRFRHNNQ